MKNYTWLLPLPFLALACAIDAGPEDINSSDSELKSSKTKPSWSAKKKPAGPSCATIKCAQGFSCVDSKKGGQCVPTLSCDNVLCEQGSHCIETDKGPECVPDLSCANVLCAKGNHCIETDKGPECVPNVTCATIKCASGTHCVDGPSGGECVPDLSCDTVLCKPGHACEEDCNGKPVCAPTVCEGFAGFACPSDFSCIKDSKSPDKGGKCVKDCAPSCGECVSDNQCGKGQKCTAAKECLTSCSCPMCDVCAGHCVAAN
jgi:hypothetical protein